MRKSALKVGEEYALWTSHYDSYETATKGRRYSWPNATWVDNVKRVRMIALDQHRDVPAGKFTKETIKVPVIVYVHINDDGTDGKREWTRKSANFIAPYAEWAATNAEQIASRAFHIEQEAADKADRQRVGAIVAGALGLAPKAVRVESYRDGETNKRRMHVHVHEISMTAVEKLVPKRGASKRSAESVVEEAAGKMAASAKKAVKK